MPVEPSIKWMDLQAISQLKTGDIIRGKSSGIAYVVTAQYGTRATAVTSVDVTNPGEWEVMRPAQELLRRLETDTGEELDRLAQRYSFGRRILDLEPDSSLRERIRPWVIRELGLSDQPAGEP